MTTLTPTPTPTLTPTPIPSPAVQVSVLRAAWAKTLLLGHAFSAFKIFTFDKTTSTNKELIPFKNVIVAIFRGIILIFSFAIGTIVTLLLQKKESDEDKFNRSDIVILTVCGWFCATTLIGFISFHSRIK